MDRDTVNQIAAMLDARRDAIYEEWEAGEKGTQASGERLAQAELLSEVKWQIIEAADAEAKSQV